MIFDNSLAKGVMLMGKSQRSISAGGERIEPWSRGRTTTGVGANLQVRLSRLKPRRYRVGCRGSL